MTIQFSSVENAIKAIEIINKISYEGRRLAAYHMFGGLKYDNGKMIENFE
jgi:hypothetical protein